MNTREPSGYLHFFFKCASYIKDKKVKQNIVENYGDFRHSLKDFGFYKIVKELQRDKHKTLIFEIPSYLYIC